MKTGSDLNVLVSKMYQLREEMSGFDKVVSNERLTSVVLDVLLAEIFRQYKFRLFKILM